MPGGLRFERNEKTGRSLDDVIFQDAARAPHALPLLEYTLAELYRQRDHARHLITFAAYVELGGVEGAIGKRADEAFASLPPEAQAALDEIMPLLVSVDIAGEQAAVRRRASEAELTSTPARKSLVDSLVAARFLTTDRQDDLPIVSLAHEALLRRWDRIVNWIDTNREQLRLRSRVEQTQQHWEDQGRNDSLLLAEGLPLDEGQQILRQAPYLLTGSTIDYIHASIAYRDRKSQQSRRQRRAVFSTITALLVTMIIGGAAAIYTINKRTVIAENARVVAENAKRQAEVSAENERTQKLVAEEQTAEAIKATKRAESEREKALLAAKAEAEAKQAAIESSKIAIMAEAEAVKEKVRAEQEKREADNARVAAVNERTKGEMARAKVEERVDTLLRTLEALKAEAAAKEKAVNSEAKVVKEE